MSFEQGFVVDIHFDSIEDLKKGFSAFRGVLPDQGPVYELNLRLHWTPANLSTQALVECRKFANFLGQKLPDIPVYMEFPFCSGEKAQFATFPNCQECAFHAADWCRWPHQMGNHQTSYQKEFHPHELGRLTADDFKSSGPLTWFFPQRYQIKMIASQLGKSGHILDFGSGSGFISYLLGSELPCSSIIGVDPNVQPMFEHPSVRFQKELPETVPDTWALLSSLADFRVPFEKCLEMNSLPRDIAFIRFPQVFGNPGVRTRVEIVNGNAAIQKEDLFDLNQLEALGYKLLCREPVPSHFFDDTELRIYSRVDGELSPLGLVEPYAWEKSVHFKNLTTSVEALS